MLSSSSAAETNTDTILYVLLVTGDGVNCEAVNTCSGIHFPSVSLGANSFAICCSGNAQPADYHFQK